MPSDSISVQRFREREELLDFLLEIAQATSETLELERLLPRVADLVQRVIPVSLFAILLYDERMQGLRIRYAIGHREEVANSLIVTLGEGITGAAAQSRSPVVVGDVRDDARYLSSIDAVRSEAAIPMVANGELVGVIDVQSPQLNAFSEEHASLLELLASRVAAAIRNADLHGQVEAQNATLTTLAGLSLKFSSILSPDDLFDQIAAEVHRLIPYDAFSVYLVDREAKLLRSHYSLRHDERVNVDNVPFGRGVTGAAMASGRAVRVANTLAEPRYISIVPEIRSELAVPMLRQDEVVGVINLESARVNFFTERDEALLTLLAAPIAISVENARLYEDIARRERDLQTDLQAAWELQKVMVPTVPPRVEGLEIALGFRPARRISGDLYQFYDLGDGQWLVAFGDVSGKGVAAALYGALVSGLLSTLAPRKYSPASLLKATNHMLMRRQMGTRYIALMVLSWDAATRQIKVANAGSSPLLVYRGGSILEPEATGIPLGMVKGTVYDEIAIATAPGDVLLLYSDGIPDQVNSEGQLYSVERLKSILRSHGGRTPKELTREIYRDVSGFAGAAPPTDDQTIIAIRVS